MNWRSLPYSIIGLTLMTAGLVGVTTFHNQQLVDIGHQTANLMPAADVGPQMTEIKVKGAESEVLGTITQPSRPRPQVALSDFQAQSISQDGEQAEAPAYSYECGPTAEEADRYAFEVLNSEFSSQVEPGQEFEVAFYVKNIGTSTWCGENTHHQNPDLSDNAFKLRFGTARPQDRASSILVGEQYRVSMVEPLVLPEETATFVIHGRAPEASGIYREFYQPVVENLKWFPSHEVSFDLYVGDYNVDDLNKLTYLRKTGSTNEIDPSQELKIHIDLANQTEYVYLGDKLIHEYLVSSGAWDTPTPTGTYTIFNKQVLRIGGNYPHYRMPYWMGLRDSSGRFRGYGLHGLPYLGNVVVDDAGSIVTKGNFWKEAIGHLGTRVSHGCVRRGDSDAEWLWNIVDPEKTVIEIHRSFDRVAYEAGLT